ncbi:MAG: hypothetical protein WC829_08475 [Hyphomicrobium sp.]|jgi:hypothetical protein
MPSLLQATIAVAACIAAMALPAAAATTEFEVSGAPVTVGAQPANEGAGYSVYHYKHRGSAKSVSVTCACDSAAKPTQVSCNDVNYQCSCPSAKITCD